MKEVRLRRSFESEPAEASSSLPELLPEL